MPPLGNPLAHTKFTLNSAAVAGFFGGEEVLSTIGIMHLYEGRRWFGWYNTPGSYQMAKHIGRMANSTFWDGIFPGPNVPPAVVFGLDIKKGPQYIAALSGSSAPTGHLAYLTMERCKEEKVERMKGRETKSATITYLALKSVDHRVRVPRLPFHSAPKGRFPILVSVTACVMCGLVYDWFCFSMILLGMLSSGCTSLVLGKGRLVIELAKSRAFGAPPGHGMLIDKDDIVVIKGEERDTNIITKGRFNIDIDTDLDIELESRLAAELNGERGARNYHAIGVCSILLLIQFLLQLLLVPQGTLFGQIMFLASLSASWGYNTYLSSLGVKKNKLQAKILFHTLGDPEMRRFRAGTRTTMAVFVCLLLFHGIKSLDGAPCEKIMDEFIPGNTSVWRRWKKKVILQLLDIDEESDSLAHLAENEGDEGLSGSERDFLVVLLGDARVAFEEYIRVRGDLPPDSSC